MLTPKDIKDFFKTHFDIAVRVQGTRKSPNRKSGWIGIYLPSLPDKSHTAPLRYKKLLPPEFGRFCMGIVYAGSAALSAQDWGGNINPHMVAMYEHEWEQLLATYPAPKPEPVGA